MNDTVESLVRDFVTQSFLFGDAALTPATDESLIERGIVDSTGVLELVAFVEETFSVEVRDAEIVPANFDSLARIADYVRGKQSLAAVA